jgi:hypothetical protein
MARRFVPSSERLESRQLLATTTTTNPLTSLLSGTATNTNTEPITPDGKVVRIQHIPALLASVQTDRFLPKDTVAALQADVRAVEGELHGPAPAIRFNFENQERNILAEPSLRVGDALALNRAMGLVLGSAGASDAQVASFEGDMSALAVTDAADSNPVKLLANDYAIVLQAAITVGLPIQAPPKPRLAAADTTGLPRNSTTFKTQPKLVGSYPTGATIQIVDAQGDVLGSEVIPASGLYTVQFSKPLSLGTHVVAVRITNGQINSAPSPFITVTVVSPPPSKATHPTVPRA